MKASHKYQNEDESVGCYVYGGLVHVKVSEDYESATVALDISDVDQLIDALIEARAAVAPKD